MDVKHPWTLGSRNPEDLNGHIRVLWLVPTILKYAPGRQVFPDPSLY